VPVISVPSPQGEASFVVEDGVLAPEDGDSSLLGGEPSIDLFERFDGNVSDAADFILDLTNQGGSF
jgi:hypothetical protein